MKKAIMYGGGNIGRGFLAQLFYLSGYETVFIDVNEELVNAMNTEKQYPIYITKGDTYEEFLVKNIRAVNGRDVEAVAEEIRTATIMATAVGVNILKFVAEPIAKGIQRRCATAQPPLNIILCENKIDANIYLKELILPYLQEKEKAYMDKNIGLIEASIGRMVPATPEAIKAQNFLAICVEPYNMLPVDAAALKGEIPTLYNMIPSAPFEAYIQRKLFMHNMSHAVTAYLGALRSYEYVWQAANDRDIQWIACQALIEISVAMSKEHGIEISSLLEHCYDLLYRFQNKLLGDTVARVGKDTARKLSPSDRIVGAAMLCKKHTIFPAYILAGLAAGLLFAPEGDLSSIEICTYTKKNGVAAALSRYCDMTDPEMVACTTQFYTLLQQKDIPALIQQLQTIQTFS